MDIDAAALARRLAASLGAELVETHISWVLLTPTLAYKLKKPVRLPFVDYATPERRLHFCQEEVRLNTRLAGSLYLGVSRITGTVARPTIDGEGPALDHAVRMRRFPPGALFSEQLAAGTLAEAAVDRFAERIAQFHQAAPVAALADARPAAPSRQSLLLAALEGVLPLLRPEEAAEARGWIADECARVDPLWKRRRAAGRVRECHGDLHLANVVALDGDVAAFDCIEFDPALRWIDVLDDVAFAVMDFIARGWPAFGWRFLDAWLERTGDHDALPGLRLALVGRALVRAQVEHLRAPGGEPAYRYARTALACMRERRPQLTITHGLPGSGKSFASQRLLQEQGAIRLRSDVERKRIFGLGALESSRGAGVDLYTPAATRRTYGRLLALARPLLQAGYPVVIDAAFLRRAERDQAQALAREAGVPFSILDCDAPLPVLAARILARRGDASEADLQVLERLRRGAEPLGPQERPLVAPVERQRAATGGAPLSAPSAPAPSSRQGSSG